VDGAKTVKIFGEDIQVKASVFTIGGFSAHADQNELLSWHQRTGNPKTTFLVHGDRDVMPIFAKKLHNTQVEIPELHQQYNLEEWF
jgi:metallo-beta-lactamase family protein